MINQRLHCDRVSGLVGEIGTLWKYSSRGWGPVRCKSHPAEAGSSKKAVFHSQVPYLEHRAAPWPSTCVWSWGMKSLGHWAHSPTPHNVPTNWMLWCPLHYSLFILSYSFFPTTIGLHMPREWICALKRAAYLPWVQLVALNPAPSSSLVGVEGA